MLLFYLLIKIIMQNHCKDIMDENLDCEDNGSDETKEDCC
jgi:hypothetical protein